MIVLVFILRRLRFFDFCIGTIDRICKLIIKDVVYEQIIESLLFDIAIVAAKIGLLYQLYQFGVVPLI